MLSVIALLSTFAALPPTKAAPPSTASTPPSTTLATPAPARLVAVVAGALEFKTLPIVGLDDAVAAQELARALTAELWMLPQSGPAVRVTAKSAEVQSWNECGGDRGITVAVTAPAGALDHVMVLAAEGAPPASWQRRVTPWDHEKRGAAIAILRQTRCAGVADCKIGIAGTVGVGAVARIVYRVPQDDDGELLTWEVVDVVLDDAGAVVSSSSQQERGFSAPDSMPVALRDVVGDAAPEVIMLSSCNTTVGTLGGTALFTSVNRCCGC